MIIYVEDLRLHGADVQALRGDAARWREIQSALVERAFASFDLREN